MLTIKVKKQLAQFSFQIDHTFTCHGITALLGVSGSGKTTLINLINVLTKPDSGYIEFRDRILVNVNNNVFITPAQRHIGTVFQDPLLFPHYSVKKNLCYGTQSNSHKRFDEIVEVLNIGKLLSRYPAMLSGGEKQRVAIGRALLSDPQLLLMDEPLSALDMPRKKELLHYIRQLVDEINIPIIYVTHNLNEARQLANTIALIEQGTLKAYDETETMLSGPYFADWL